MVIRPLTLAEISALPAVTDLITAGRALGWAAPRPTNSPAPATSLARSSGPGKPGWSPPPASSPSSACPSPAAQAAITVNPAARSQHRNIWHPPTTPSPRQQAPELVQQHLAMTHRRLARHSAPVGRRPGAAILPAWLDGPPRAGRGCTHQRIPPAPDGARPGRQQVGAGTERRAVSGICPGVPVPGPLAVPGNTPATRKGFP